MGVNQAFLSFPLPPDWLMVCQLGDRQVWDDWDGAKNYLQALEPSEVYVQPNTTTQPGWLAARCNGFILVSSTGTLNVVQWCLHTFNAIQVPTLSGSPGTVCLSFNVWAWVQWNQMKGLLQQWGGPVVFVGHSLGGALAIVLADYAASSGFQVNGVYVAGCPSPGDRTFSSTYLRPVYRLEDTDDPVVSLPPRSLPSTWGFPPWVNPTLRFVTATPVGSAWTQDSSGVQTVGTFPLDFGEAIQALISGRYHPHLAKEYVRRLMVAWSPAIWAQPNSYGYAQPWILWNLTGPPPNGQPLPPPPPNDGSRRPVGSKPGCTAPCS